VLINKSQPIDFLLKKSQVTCLKSKKECVTLRLSSWSQCTRHYANLGHCRETTKVKTTFHAASFTSGGLFLRRDTPGTTCKSLYLADALGDHGVWRRRKLLLQLVEQLHRAAWRWALISHGGTLQVAPLPPTVTSLAHPVPKQTTIAFVMTPPKYLYVSKKIKSHSNGPTMLI